MGCGVSPGNLCTRSNRSIMKEATCKDPGPVQEPATRALMIDTCTQTNTRKSAVVGNGICAHSRPLHSEVKSLVYDCMPNIHMITQTSTPVD